MSLRIWGADWRPRAYRYGCHDGTDSSKLIVGPLHGVLIILLTETEFKRLGEGVMYGVPYIVIDRQDLLLFVLDSYLYSDLADTPNHVACSKKACSNR